MIKLGWLLLVCHVVKFLGLYSLYNIKVKSSTFRRGSEVSQVKRAQHQEA